MTNTGIRKSIKRRNHSIWFSFTPVMCVTQWLRLYFRVCIYISSCFMRFPPYLFSKKDIFESLFACLNDMALPKCAFSEKQEFASTGANSLL